MTHIIAATFWILKKKDKHKFSSLCVTTQNVPFKQILWNCWWNLVLIIELNISKFNWHPKNCLLYQPKLLVLLQKFISAKQTLWSGLIFVIPDTGIDGTVCWLYFDPCWQGSPQLSMTSGQISVEFSATIFRMLLIHNARWGVNKVLIYWWHGFPL